jgi:hypothetical protein
MSELDIGAGQRWASELWKELQDGHFGVVCLTAENLQAPWLHFEAGALAKAVAQQVCPYLYELKPSDVKGPLSHFQMKQANKKETRELLQSINEASSALNERSLLPEHLDEAFEAWWPKLETELHAMPPSPTAAPPPRDERDMLEEILEIVRGQAIRPPIPSAETGSAVDIAWTKWIEFINTQRTLAEMMQDREVRAHIERKVQNMEAALAVFRPKDPVPSSDTPQEGQPPSN